MRSSWIAFVLVVCCAASAGALELTLKDADVRLQLYGYVKADFVYETQATEPKSEFSFWVAPEVDGKRDAQTRVGARESRIGLAVMGPDVGEWKTHGKIEMDFYGGGNPNSYSPRMRLAYADFAHSSGFSLRVGQDWDTFVEAMSRVVNFGALADIGALGLRRPQARATQELKFSDASKLVLKAALAQTVGQDLDGGGFDDGADAEWPTFQFNAALHQKLWTEMFARIGVSGHYGRETLDGTEKIATTNAAGVVTETVRIVSRDAKDYDTWSVQGSLYLPLTQCIAVQGNVWTGENLDTYFGAIGQGVNLAKDTAIAAKGGWAQLLYDPTAKWSFGLGYSIDDPDDEDLNPGMRSKTQQVFVNAFYKVTSAVTAMAEYARMTTDYLEKPDASTDRVQFSVRYGF